MAGEKEKKKKKPYYYYDDNIPRPFLPFVFFFLRSPHPHHGTA
jgi:hypothetical protein